MTSHAKSLDKDLVEVPEGHGLRKAVPVLLVAGLVLWLAAVAWGLLGGEEIGEVFFPSYLQAFTFWLSLSLGAMIFVLLQWAAKAGWSVTVRRVAENAMAVSPLMILLVLPLLFGLHELFEWTHVHDAAHAADPYEAAHAELLAAKTPYLNTTFFGIRLAVYLLAWLAIGWLFRRASVRQDETGDHDLTRKMQWWSGPAILAYAFTVTFFAFDWLMSLEPAWYSTIFGGYFFAGALVAALSFMTIVFMLLKGAGFVGDAVNVEHFHDLGKLIFAFIVFWTYLAFSQFMLIWYANIPEETHFYQVRAEGGWLSVSIFLGVGHFIVPFFFLLSRHVKRFPVTLFLGAAYVLAIHWVDVWWLIAPNFHEAPFGGEHGFDRIAFDVLCTLGVGALWLAAFLWLTVRARLVPVKDPRLHEALAFENY